MISSHSPENPPFGIAGQWLLPIFQCTKPEDALSAYPFFIV